MEARIASEKALIAQIRNRAAVGIAVAVDPTKYQAALAHDKFALTPYTFCLSMCVTGANRWALENGVKELAFFFESGHADQSQANDLMNRISKNIPPQSRTYVSHTFADKKLVQPLQAADMLAWQYAHYLIRRRDGHPMRKDFVALRRPTDKFVEFVDDHIQKWVQLNDELNREVLEQIRQIYPDDPQAVQYAESVLNNRPSAPAA